MLPDGSPNFARQSVERCVKMLGRKEEEEEEEEGKIDFLNVHVESRILRSRLRWPHLKSW